MDLYSLLISADVVLKNLTHIIVSEDSEGYQPLFSLNLAEDNKDKDIINDIIEYAKKRISLWSLFTYKILPIKNTTFSIKQIFLTLFRKK